MSDSESPMNFHFSGQHQILVESLFYSVANYFPEKRGE